MRNPLTRKAYILGLTATTLLVAAVGLLTRIQFDNARLARYWVQHTVEVIDTAQDLSLALRDAEINQRSFLLTGQENYFSLYQAAVDSIARFTARLRRLTVDNPTQQDRLFALTPVIQDNLEELAQTAQRRREGGLQAVLSEVQANVQRQRIIEIERILSQIRAEEDRLIADRRAAFRDAQAAATWLALGGSAIAVMLLITAAWLLAQARARLVRSEAEQRRMAGQMRAAFDSVSQGIGVFNADNCLARWNECFVGLLCLPHAITRSGMAYGLIAERATAEAGTGKPFLETDDEIRQAQGAQVPRQPVVYERLRAKDGRSFEIRRTPMSDGGFVLTVTDITERVRAEATARDAQRLQAMGQLTGGIAHDFNNLLTVIIGNLEFAQSQAGAGSPVLPRIERAMWGARRGAALTQHLLAFARKQPLTPMPIDLSAMLPDMATLLRRTLGEHIDIRVVDAAGLWPAMADPAQVESALLNLALNARDAMPGGGRLTIEVANKVLDQEYARHHAEVTPGDYVMLAVSDTGTGMPQDVLARVFEPFFTTKPPGRGTGLGLAMVYGFAKQSGGHVNIYSEPGEGTTVRLYLPRAVGVLLPSAQRTGMPAELPRGSATVLVVEDDAAVREVSASMLRDLGYRVLEASDGPEALRVFGENDAKVDLLLADIVLPGPMKGHEVAHRLAQVRPELRILFMSGYTENAIVHHGRLDDGLHLIGKPFQREQLARKVAETLGTAREATPGDGDRRVVDLGPRQRGRGE